MFSGNRISELSCVETFNGANRDQTIQTVSVCDSGQRNQHVDTMAASVEFCLHAFGVG